jgi:hypothetical protein
VERITLPIEKIPVKHVQDLLGMVLSSKKLRTSIPKEIKFLKPHYNKLTEFFHSLSNQELK